MKLLLQVGGWESGRINFEIRLTLASVELELRLSLAKYANRNINYINLNPHIDLTHKITLSLQLSR